MPRSSVFLYLGDVLAIVLFAIMGRQSHGMSTGIAAAGEILDASAPFLLGWFLVAPWFGAFQPEAWQDVRSAVLAVLKAIVPALIVAILLRALFAGGFSPAMFYLVAGSFMLLLLIVWRLIYTVVIAPRLSV